MIEAILVVCAIPAYLSVGCILCRIFGGRKARKAFRF